MVLMNPDRHCTYVEHPLNSVDWNTHRIVHKRPIIDWDLKIVYFEDNRRIRGPGEVLTIYVDLRH